MFSSISKIHAASICAPFPPIATCSRLPQRLIWWRSEYFRSLFSCGLFSCYGGLLLLFTWHKLPSVTTGEVIHNGSTVSTNPRLYFHSVVSGLLCFIYLLVYLPFIMSSCCAFGLTAIHLKPKPTSPALVCFVGYDIFFTDQPTSKSTDSNVLNTSNGDEATIPTLL